MNISKLSWIVILISLFALVCFGFVNFNILKVSAAVSNHVLISEIQIAGIKSGDHNQFIELYNPTQAGIDLSGWRLTRKTTKGTQSTLVKSISGIIPSHGYFLIIPQSGFTGSVSADQKYSSSKDFLTNNNAVLLFSDAGKTLVDKVGMGSASDFETLSTQSPKPGKSVERKANSQSTAVSQSIGGADEFAGNGEDTGNNNADFVVMDTPDPKNSSSPLETPFSPTPTASVTPVLTDTPTPTSITPTLTPTLTPSATPTPTLVLSLTPTPTATLTPTFTPTPTPTATPIPTLSPTPTASVTPVLTDTPTPTSITPTLTLTITPTLSPTLTPSITPSPTAVTPTITPTPTQITPTPTTVFPTLVCTTKYLSFNILSIHIKVPLVSCSLN